MEEDIGKEGVIIILWKVLTIKLIFCDLQEGARIQSDFIQEVPKFKEQELSVAGRW